MQIKKYVANNIQEALRQVKKELGPEALILSVYNIKAMTGPLALMSPARVEVTAAIDEDHQANKYPANALPSAQDRVKKPFHSSNQYADQYAKEEQKISYKEEQKLPLFQRVQGEGREDFDQSPDLDSRQNRALQGQDGVLSPSHNSGLRNMTQGAKHMAQSLKDALKGSLRTAYGETGRQRDSETGRQRDGETGRYAFVPQSPSPPVPPSPQQASGLQQSAHISSLSHLLKKIGLKEDIVEHIIDVLSHEIPCLNYDKGSKPGLAEGYTSSQLEGLARNILQQLIKTSGPIEAEGVRGRGEGEGERGGDRPFSPRPPVSPSPSLSYPQSGPSAPNAGPKYVALVGPTGTGKTTTIAKLSADLLLNRKKKVGLITIDTYRVGAMEQLNTYAEIMNIPVKEASTFEQMRKAVLQYQDQDVVLIDTAGFSHLDREHLQLLNAFLAQVSNPEIHLVLSTNTDEKELIHISQSFNLLHYEKLLFTKLDESSYPGKIFNHMIYTGKPISYITTGQKVPEDIEVATQAGIINLMFQEKKFYPSSTLQAEL